MRKCIQLFTTLTYTYYYLHTNLSTTYRFKITVIYKNSSRAKYSVRGEFKVTCIIGIKELFQES